MILVYLIIGLSAVPNHPWFGESAGGITLIKIVGFVALAYALFYLPLRRTPVPLLKEWPARLFIVLIVWASISALTSGMRAALAQSALKLYASFASIFFMLVVTIDSRLRLERAVLSLLGALAFASLYSLREYELAGFSAYRPGWVAGDANLFAAATLITMPVAYHLVSASLKRWQRWFCLGTLVLTFLAFVVSASRGAFVGFCLTFVVMLWRTKSKLGLIAVTLVAIPILLFAPMSPISRIVSPQYADVSSENAHHALWKFGVQMAIEHPITGIGLGNFKATSEKYQVLQDGGLMGHNSYIEIAAEMGVFAFLVFLGILGSSIGTLEKVRRQAILENDGYMKMLATGLQEGLIGFAVAAFFFSAEYEKPYWIVVFFAALLPSFSKNVPVRTSTGKSDNAVDEIRSRNDGEGENCVQAWE